METNSVACEQQLKDEYLAFIADRTFPCIAGKAALAKQQIHCMVAGHMACPADDRNILKFIYGFVDTFRNAGSMYHSAAVIFKGPDIITEKGYETFLWQRLQALSDMDSQQYAYDQRVERNPESPEFSFSLKEEAFFIIGMHPASSRLARRFQRPAIVFNPHVQFTQLRQNEKYEPMKMAVRKKDMSTAGSINPMLTDHGSASEAFQYSGQRYESNWQCPLKVKHA